MMGGWKTWLGIGIVMVGAALHATGFQDLAETAYALGGSFGAVGIGSKLTKVLSMVGAGATEAAKRLGPK